MPQSVQLWVCRNHDVYRFCDVRDRYDGGGDQMHRDAHGYAASGCASSATCMHTEKMIICRAVLASLHVKILNFSFCYLKLKPLN